jgi:NAD(P)-dependent dehydrogenase (short-subunit alcohol dehydrogenase family)
MTSNGLKVLILGGYGTFGGRLAQLLADEDRLTLVIAGRSLERAKAFCAHLPPSSIAAAFDRDGDVERQLRDIAPDIVVDATGPFQSYGEDPYRVVSAAIALGIHYLDLADSSDFVKGVARFDADARARNVFVLAGVSSFPVLTAAVVRRLAPGMARVDRITGGIAPSPFANVGMNVIRAIASYAGKPVPMVRDGKSAIGYGLIDDFRFTIAPPGRLPLDPVRFSLVDVPDLTVLPQLWPEVRTVWMGAGPVPAIWHRALNAFAWLVRLRVLPSLSSFAPLMYQAINWLSFGEHRGGMFVAVAGVGAAGEHIERSWHLVAEGADGPLIPSMAAEAIIRNCLAGRQPAAGARPAVTDLELADYEPLLARKRISTGFRQDTIDKQPSDARAPLYRRILAEAWNSLPPPLQTMHDLEGELTAEGVAEVERGQGWLARALAWVIGFPDAGRDVPVAVSFRAEGGREIWTRTFAGRSFTSIQEAGRGRFERLLCERFGPMNFGMALVWEDGRLKLVQRRWSFCGVPMPRALAPRSNAYEFAEDGRFHFHVEIGHPLTGLIVGYRGWLAPRT